MSFNLLLQKTEPSDFPRFLKACERLGFPEKSFPAIHIAGTNGKGSVAAKCAKILQLSGYKAGLYTSPHLVSYTERISISGRQISEEEIEAGLQMLLPWEECRNYFEITTLLAFDHFRKHNVDMAVIETGIGGKLDATNVVQPLVSVITSIGEDHRALLGNTLEEIAEQKGGIIKPNVPVVLGPAAQLPILFSQAKSRGAPVIPVAGVFAFYDEENSAIAKAAIKASGLAVSPRAMQEGLSARPRCRFEVQGRVVYDVAHNPGGFKRLLEALENHFPGRPFRMFLGFSQDKEIVPCLNLCASKARHIYLTHTNSSRSAIPQQLASYLDALGYSQYSMNKTLEEALTESEDLLVVAGSFYLKEMQDAL